MIKNNALSGTADGITQQQYGDITLKAGMGIEDGHGQFTPGADLRVETLTKNYTSPEFLSDLFGNINITVADNLPYQIVPRFGVGENNKLQSSQTIQNLNLPAVYTVLVSLQNHGYSTGYKVDYLMQKTCSQWSEIMGAQEQTLMENKKTLEINKTLYGIILTALATGNFKTIPGLENLDASNPDAKQTFANLKATVTSYGMKWNSINHGVPNNYQILFSPFAMQAALANATALTPQNAETFKAYQQGEIALGYGFKIRQFNWLNNNFGYNDANDITQRLTTNLTTTNYNFTGCTAVLYVPGNVERYCKAPFGEFPLNTDENGFFPLCGAGYNQPGSSVLYGKVGNFTLDVFVKPFRESENIAIFEKAPSVQEVLNARIALATAYPNLYRGINATNGYMVGDSDGTKTKAMINQGITASKVYQYGSTYIPQDSNIFGFDANLVNINGIIAPGS